MGIAQKASGASWSKVRSSLLVQDRRYLIGEYVFGDTLAKTIVNRADPSKPLVVIGSPTINAKSATVKSDETVGFGFETQIKSSDDRTLILVRKNPAFAVTTAYAGRKNIAGEPNDIGWALRSFGANNYAGNGESDSNYGSGGVRPTPSTSSFFMEAAVAVPAGYGQLHWWQGGVRSMSTSSVLATAPRHRLNTPIATVTAVGGTGLRSGYNLNTFEVAYMIEFNRALTGAELDKIYASVAADMGRRSMPLH